MAGFITSCVILLTILVLTPLFPNLPIPVLASVVMVAVLNLVEVGVAVFALPCCC